MDFENSFPESLYLQMVNFSVCIFTEWSNHCTSLFCLPEFTQTGCV